MRIRLKQERASLSAGRSAICTSAAKRRRFIRFHPLPLRDTSPDGLKFSFHVERMRWNADKATLKVNPSIELSGFTPEMFGYKLGNRSALDWVVESYRVKEDARSGLTSDPNRADEPNFILDLVGRVASVSLETMRLVGELPRLFSG
ncbi:MAG TPA: type ISP restriction/modification enzyme [Abditibacterium sp.]